VISKGPARLKVILDTSVCVAALLSKSGGSAKIFETVLRGEIYNFYTDEILEEINKVLEREKFKLEKEKQEHFIHLFAEASFLIKPIKELEVAKCRDPKDDIFLSLANQIEADFLISLDMDLIDLKKIGATRIVNPSAFINQA
jgi:putative PIN family toxin of toxin-antitoxin system